MRETDIAAYAKSLLEAHGDRAEAEATAKMRDFEKSGDPDQAEAWRKIKAAINQMRGPHSS